MSIDPMKPGVSLDAKGKDERASLDLLLTGEAETMAMGRDLGQVLEPGAVVLLTGDLGAGKTVTARGIAQGLGVPDDYVIASPTFTLLNIYPGRLEFFHADLYRLEAGDAEDLELLDQAGQGVLAVEWAERAPGIWPEDSIVLKLSQRGENDRRAEISGPALVVDALKRRMNSARGEG